MSDLIPSQFVSPSPRSELNGELGLDLHEIAKSLGMRFADLKEKVERMKKANRISLTAFATYNENNRLVDSYILDVENAKFLVTKTDTEIGDAYTRHLIQCEKEPVYIDANPGDLFTAHPVEIPPDYIEY